MAKDPAFLFYHHDFLVGVAFMSMAERGAYITILCYMADKGFLTLAQIKAICVEFDPKQLLEEKFKIDENGNYYHHRLIEEITKRKNWCGSRKNNKEGHNQYTKKRSYDLNSFGHMVNVNVNENIKDNIKNKYLDCVELSIDEYAKLVDKFTEKGAKDRIEELNTGIMSKGYKYKSHYHAILSWEKRRISDNNGKPKPMDHKKRLDDTQEYLRKLEAGQL